MDYQRGIDLYKKRIDLLQRYVTGLQTKQYTGRIITALVASSIDIEHWERSNDIS